MYLFRVVLSNNIDEYYKKEPDDMQFAVTVEASSFDDALNEAKFVVNELTKTRYGGEFSVVSLNKLDREVEFKKCSIDNPCEDCIEMMVRDSDRYRESYKDFSHGEEEFEDCGDDSACDEPRCPSYRKYEEEPVKKAAEIWCYDTGIEILDPDGWDRRDYDNSWCEEITREEFIRRAAMSTCRAWPKPLLDGGPSF